MPGGAAFFDLDKTVIATSSTLAMGRSFYTRGLISRRTVVKGAYAKLLYELGGVDEARMAQLRDGLARMITGWPVEQVREVVDEAFRDLIGPLVYAEAAALISDHHAAGRQVVLVSTSGEEVVGPVGEMLGADEVIATRMVVDEGRYTGEMAFYAFGPHKAAAMAELAARHGWDLADCYAYSDSATDVPMLAAVGHPHAVNPDRGLRRAAAERGWPVLRFRHPVPMRRRSGVPGRRVGLAGAGVVVSAAGWRLLRGTLTRVRAQQPG